jgi:DNA polymerase-1
MKLHGTVSGRLSSTPNVQNLPRKTFKIVSPTGRVIEPTNIRGIFTAPPPFKLFSSDLSQAELRIMADYADDFMMLDYIKRNVDIHWTGCLKIFYGDKDLIYDKNNSEMKRLRKLTKLCNFGGLYGGSDRKKVSSVNEKLELGEPKIDMRIAGAHTEWFNSEFPDIQKYIKEQEKHILQYGWIDNKFGRRRRLPDALSKDEYLRAEACRQGINAQIQGTASDIVQLSMIRIVKWLEDNDMKSKIIWSVHDEVDGYAHPDEIEILKEIVPKMMCEKVPPIDKIKVALESEFDVFKNRWGD